MTILPRIVCAKLEVTARHKCKEDMDAFKGNMKPYLQGNRGVQEGTPMQVGCISRAGGETRIKQQGHYVRKKWSK